MNKHCDTFSIASKLHTGFVLWSVIGAQLTYISFLMKLIKSTEYIPCICERNNESNNTSSLNWPTSKLSTHNRACLQQTMLQQCSNIRTGLLTVQSWCTQRWRYSTPFLDRTLTLLSLSFLSLNKAVQRTAISHAIVFFRTFCFSLNLTGTLNLTKIVHYHWSRMGNTSCLIGNLKILGYMHIVSIRTPFVPS